MAEKVGKNLDKGTKLFILFSVNVIAVLRYPFVVRKAVFKKRSWYRG
jgi:hypothetical protein